MDMNSSKKPVSSHLNTSARPRSKRRLAPVSALFLAMAAAAIVGCSPSSSWGNDPAAAAGSPARFKGGERYYYFIRSNYEEIKANANRVPPAAALKYMINASELDPGSGYLKLETARLLARNEKREAALKYAQEAISLDPANPAPRKFAAWISAGAKQWDNAINHYKEVLKLAPDDTEALIYLGALYKELGRLDEAEGLYKQMAETDPSFKSFYFLGLYYVDADRPQEAVKALTSAVKKKPDDIEALIELAGQQEKLKNFKAAEKNYRAAIAVDPDQVKPRVRLADMLAGNGRKAEADKVLSDIDLKEQSGQDQFGLGLLYRDQGLYEKAVDAFQSVVENDPGNDRARFFMGLSYLGFNQTDKAREQLGRITKEKDTFVDAQIILARLVENDDVKKRMREALAMLDGASRARPDSARLIIARSQYMIELDELDNARKILLAAARKLPKEADIYFQIGVVEDKLDNKTATIKAMRKAIEINPEHADALNYLAYTWAERKENLKEALAMAERADRLKPNSGYIIDTLAWIHFQLGDAAKALVLLEAAVPLSNQDPVVLGHLGDVQMALGHTEDALASYRQALDTEYIATQQELQEELNDKIKRLSN